MKTTLTLPALARRFCRMTGLAPAYQTPRPAAGLLTAGDDMDDDWDDDDDEDDDDDFDDTDTEDDYTEHGCPVG